MCASSHMFGDLRSRSALDSQTLHTFCLPAHKNQAGGEKRAGNYKVCVQRIVKGRREKEQIRVRNRAYIHQRKGRVNRVEKIFSFNFG